MAALRFFLAALLMFGVWLPFGEAALLAAAPEFGGIYPQGCSIGGSAEVTLSGSGIGDDARLIFAHPGIAAEYVEKTTFRIHAAADVPSGDYDVWLASPQGLSGPRRLAVSKLPEVVENDKNQTAETAQEVKLPAVVNARFAKSAETDWFALPGKAGLQVTISARSLSLDNSAAPVLTLLDPNGREIAHSRGGDDEPTLHVGLAENGTYRLRVVDREYRGGADYGYRLQLETGPRLIAAWPHTLRRDATTPVTLYGYSLPGGKFAEIDGYPRLQELTVDVSTPPMGSPIAVGWTLNQAASLESFALQQPGAAGEVPLLLAEESLVIEDESSNDTFDAAQPVQLPCDIAGRFLTLGDQDWYRFTAKKGQSVQLETFGAQLGQKMDLQVAVHQVLEKPLVLLEDVKLTAGLPAKASDATPDPRAVWKAPADGEYRVIVRDQFGSVLAGPQRRYRLRLTLEDPPVSVLAVHVADAKAEGLTVPENGRAALQLVVHRRGGFNGALRVRAAEEVPSLSIPETWIGPGQHTALLSIAGGEPGQDALRWLTLIADRGEGKTTSPVHPAAVTRNGDPNARLLSGLPAVIAGWAPLKLGGSSPLKATTDGGKLEVELSIERAEMSKQDGPLKITWPHLPGKVTAKEVTLAADADKVKCQLTVPKGLPEGRYTLVARAVGKFTGGPGSTNAEDAKDKDAAKDKPVQTAEFTLWSQPLLLEVVKP